MTKLTSSLQVFDEDRATVQCCNDEVGHHVITDSRHPWSPEADNHNSTCGNTTLVLYPSLYCISRLLDQILLVY